MRILWYLLLCVSAACTIFLQLLMLLSWCNVLGVKYKSDKTDLPAELIIHAHGKVPYLVSNLHVYIYFTIQYYFGDANLERDKFLKAEMKKDDGWVTIVTLLTFNRLKAMSEDASVIVAAVKKSSNDLLEVGMSCY